MSKSALIFAGRIHHIQKLATVYRGLQQLQWNVQWVTTNNSINMDPHTEPLLRTNTPFLHVLDYQDEARVLDSAKQLTSIFNKKEPSLLDCVPPFWVAHSLHEASQCLVGFRNILDEQKPDYVLALHANNFFARILLYCAQERGVPTVIFQEGKLRMRDEKTMGKQSMAADYSSLLCVWSDFSKEVYIKAGISPDKVHVTGMAHLDPILQMQQFDPQWKNSIRNIIGLPVDRQIVVFAPPQVNRYEGDINKALSVITNWAYSNHICLVIKLHPFDDGAERQLSGQDLNGAILAREKEGQFYMAAADMVLCQHSTVALEALVFDTPVVEIDLDHVGILEGEAEKGIAFRVHNTDTLLDILNGKVKPDADKLVEYKQKYLGPLDGHSTERVIGLLK